MADFYCKESYFKPDISKFWNDQEYYWLEVDNLPEVKSKKKSLKALEFLLEDNDDLLRTVIENLGEKINYLNNVLEQLELVKKKLNSEEDDDLKEFDEVNELVERYTKEIL